MISRKEYATHAETRLVLIRDGIVCGHRRERRSGARAIGLRRIHEVKSRGIETGFLTQLSERLQLKSISPRAVAGLDRLIDVVRDVARFRMEDVLRVRIARRHFHPDAESEGR